MLSKNFMDFYKGTTLQDRVYKAFCKDYGVVIREGKRFLLVLEDDFNDIMEYTTRCEITSQKFKEKLSELKKEKKI